MKDSAQDSALSPDSSAPPGGGRHTPIPWVEVGGGRIDGADGHMVASTLNHAGASERTIYEINANRAFIVKAVNNHERLSAIEVAARAFIDNCPSDDRDVPYLSEVADVEFRALVAASSRSEESPALSERAKR